MQEELPCIRYYAQDYGGRLFTETQRNTTRNVMYAKGLVNQIERTICL
jgi:hypothetical protein